MDPAAESINWERIGITQKAAAMMKLLWRQARAFDSLANGEDGYQSMELEKMFLRAISGPSRLNVAKPAARVSWWWTSRTILGRVGHMRTFIQDMDQYIFHTIWICFIIYDCPKKWWVWVPVPVTFALVDSTFSKYCSSNEKSAALHQEDGLVAFRPIGQGLKPRVLRGMMRFITLRHKTQNMVTLSCQCLRLQGSHTG